MNEMIRIKTNKGPEGHRKRESTSLVYVPKSAITHDVKSPFLNSNTLAGFMSLCTIPIDNGTSDYQCCQGNEVKSMLMSQY
jgi:hypothetical protein